MAIPDFLNYQGARAIVTGAGSGIGRAVAIGLVEHGAKVTLVGRRVEALQQTAELAQEAVGDHRICYSIEADLSDEAVPAKVVKESVDLMGGVDLLVNCAAKLHREPQEGETTDATTWQQVMQTNLRAPYLLSRHCLAYLRENQGAIVNISSIWAHIGAKGQAAYSTSKAAMVELTRSMARDFADDRIRVNCVCPSTTRTPLIYQGRGSFDEQAVAAVHPLGRIGEPDDVANAVLFLGSKQAAGWITGTTLTVDGGYTA